MKIQYFEKQRPGQYQSQQGQALLEAVLTLTALIGLIFAIQLTGQIRTHSLELLGKSSYLSFLETLKKSARNDQTPRNQGRFKTKEHANLETRFAEQLLYVSEEGFIQAQSKQDNDAYLRMPAYRALTPLSLSRTSYLFINAGQSDSAREVQTRIENANDPWLNAARPTRALLKSVTEPLRRIDAPWGRPQLSTDWLKSWAGQAPAPDPNE